MKYMITTTDLEGDRVEYRVEADDEAAALNHLLGEHGEELPTECDYFLIQPVRARKRRRGRKRGGTVKTSTPISEEVQAMADRLGLNLEEA